MCLVSVPIEANKYFKPYPPLSLDNLRSLAKNKTDSFYYFQQIKNYIEFEKAGNHNNDVSLQLSDAIAEAKKAVQKDIHTASFKTEIAPYTVQNNSFEKKQLQVNDSLKEMNDQWTKFLTNDPYLQITYDMMLLMIK